MIDAVYHLNTNATLYYILVFTIPEFHKHPFSDLGSLFAYKVNKFHDILRWKMYWKFFILFFLYFLESQFVISFLTRIFLLNLPIILDF